MGDRFGRPAPFPDTSGLPSRVGPGAAAQVPTQSGQLPTPQQLGGTLQINPWYVWEYPSAQDWSAVAANFAAGGNATTLATAGGFSYKVPAQNVSVIKQVTVTIQNILAASAVTWTLLRNGAPIPGWSGRLIPPLSATAIAVPYNDLVIRLAQNDVLTASITEVGGNAYTCSIEASGWHLPRTEVERLQGGIQV